MSADRGMHLMTWDLASAAAAVYGMMMLMRFNSSAVMDWPGQKSEQNALQCCLVGAATAATITWLLFQSTKAMLATYLVGVIVTFLVAVPDWDFFRRPRGDWHDVVFVDAPAHVVREIAEQRDRKWYTKISAVNAGPGTIAFDDKKLTSNHHQR